MRDLIRCECCGIDFEPLEDPSPDTLLVDPITDAPVIVVLDSKLCFPCREAEDRPIAHVLRHAGVE